MPMCHRSGDAPRAISWATLRHNAGAQCRCARAAAVGATRLTCVPTNVAASTAEALTRQPTKAAHNNVCALSQTESGLGAHVEAEDRKKPLQPIAETAPHDPFWREEPAVSRTFEPPKRSYADAAGNIVQTCMPSAQKKPPYWPIGP